ncbi:MAG: DNA cytosine methyltransferase [Nisaea sp.]|uniref:DNA cytosine methyltransferase n=1 Tax=Nisaea sp. TaxID=2024842 RepID=UPI003299322F
MDFLLVVNPMKSGSIAGCSNPSHVCRNFGRGRNVSELVGIDIFSGAGGMSTGAYQAGLTCAVSIDADTNSSATYAANHPNVKTICDDIRKIDDFSALVNAPRKVVFGGPPCQGFSTSNQRTRNASNVNNWLFEEFLRSIDQLDPDWIVFENVKGLVETDAGFFFRRIVNSFRRRGYKTHTATLNAADFGVPQNRFRVFIVGSKGDQKFSFPSPTHSAPVTVDDAIHDLPSLENGDSFDQLPYRTAALTNFSRQMRGNSNVSSGHIVSRNSPEIVERYKHIPQGGNWQNIPAELMRSYSDRSRCHTGIYRRLDPKLPSVVIGNYRKNMLIHPYEDRGLSVREAARLQSFPDDFTFEGSIGFKQQQVGNAVPPLLARAIFSSILAADSGKVMTRQGSKVG